MICLFCIRFLYLAASAFVTGIFELYYVLQEILAIGLRYLNFEEDAKSKHPLFLFELFYLKFQSWF